MVKILVTGARGQVGSEVLRSFGDAAVASSADVTDRDAVRSEVSTVRPDVVVHAAAFTDVDGCELEPDRAWAVNALGTRHVAEACRLVGARVVYLSTDYVFNGDLDRPYTEWDEPDPLSVYGRSKLAGERELSPDDTVVRTSWVFGRTGRNMVKTVLRLLDEGTPLQFVDDQRGCPTSAEDLARMVVELVRRPGVFHVTNQGAGTWHGFVRDVVALAGGDPESVTAIKTADLDPPRPAPRPRNSVLANKALELEGIALLPHYREPLARLVAELRP